MQKNIDQANVIKKEIIDNNENCRPITITDENLENIVASEKPVVIDFWADWCGPCRMMEPIVTQLVKEYCGKVTFGKLNVDENPITPPRFNIFSIPTILFFKKVF